MECYYDYYLNMCICENNDVYYNVSAMVGVLYSLIYKGLKHDDEV